MKFRHKVSRKSSRRLFTRTANRVHRKNMTPVVPMRGGIRL
jgi:hypothetical protein